MMYVTYEDLCRDIRSNLTKIPLCVSGVLGMPRSGMLPATIIAEHINVGLSTPDSVIAAGSVSRAMMEHGHRRMRTDGPRTLLVVDDTCYHGNSFAKTFKKLKHPAFSGYDFIFLAVYLEGPCEKFMPQIWLRDIREPAKHSPLGYALYEWNLFAHGNLTARTLFDLDGVFCKEPPDERNEEAYLTYIKNPMPLYVPTGDTISVCTYRLEKYRKETMDFLRLIGAERVNLFMNPAKDYWERCNTGAAWQFKAEKYKDDYWLLFVESDDYQARKIHELTGKPVVCIETNSVYD